MIQDEAHLGWVQVLAHEGQDVPPSTEFQIQINTKGLIRKGFSSGTGRMASLSRQTPRPSCRWRSTNAEVRRAPFGPRQRQYLPPNEGLVVVGHAPDTETALRWSTPPRLGAALGNRQVP